MLLLWNLPRITRIVPSPFQVSPLRLEDYTWSQSCTICTDSFNNCHQLPTSVLNLLHSFLIAVHQHKCPLANAKLDPLLVHVIHVRGHNVVLCDKFLKYIEELRNLCAIQRLCSATLQASCPMGLQVSVLCLKFLYPMFRDRFTQNC